MVAPVVARAAFPMARGLMNLIRDPNRLKKIWGQGTPDKPGMSYLNQLKGGVRQSRAKTVPHGGTPPGAINRFGRKHPYLAEAGIYAGGGLAGLTAVDRIASMMRGDEVAPDDAKAMRSGVLRSPSMPSMPSDFETRMAFEARKNKKMNKQMFRLLQNYGIVNLVNPDSASDMLKLGTAMLEQEMGQMGTDRQAKIFDAVFKNGKMPASGAEAAKMILNAGGTVEDVQDITGIYESITPKAQSKPTKAEMQWELTNQIYSAVQAGDIEQAKQLAIRGIASGMIPNIEGAHGMGLSLEDQAERLITGLQGQSGSSNLAQGIVDIGPRG